MGKASTLLSMVTIIVCFCEEGITACSVDGNEQLRRVRDANVTLICEASETCRKIIWEKRVNMDRTTLQTDEYVNTSFLRKPEITFDDNAVYICWCSGNNGYDEICEITLHVICQATVFHKGKIAVYNSVSATNNINITLGERLQVKCTDGEISSSSCSFIPKDASGEFTYNFVVLSQHHLCTITCWESDESQKYCGVSFTLHVVTSETSTQPPRSISPAPSAAFTASAQSVSKDTFSVTSTTTSFSASATVMTVSDQSSVNKSSSALLPGGTPVRATAHTTATVLVQHMEEGTSFTEKSGSFPVMVPIGISIVILVGVVFIACFFIYSSRSKSSSRPKNTQIPGNKSPDTNIPICPTYATVDKSSPGGTKDDDDSERGIPCADDAYAEVDSSGKEEPLTQQVNAIKAETPITKDYYSVVNTSTKKLELMDSGNKIDSALYTEVNKGLKEAGKNVGTSSPESSGCNPTVPDNQSYDVLEQPESSEYDDVGVASTPPALYAVVEKDRMKD